MEASLAEYVPDSVCNDRKIVDGGADECGEGVAFGDALRCADYLEVVVSQVKQVDALQDEPHGGWVVVEQLDLQRMASWREHASIEGVLWPSDDAGILFTLEDFPSVEGASLAARGFPRGS